MTYEQKAKEHWGFSGSRTGMTRAQIDGVYAELDGEPSGIGHHGDCDGADVEFHGILRNLGGWWIVAHPPIKTTLRAYCEADEWRPAKPYLKRNDDIVDECRRFLATPRSSIPDMSGTWATIRRAIKAGRVGSVIMPSGLRVSLSEIILPKVAA